MIPSIYDVYWENVLNLEKTRAQFFNRLAVLADAAVHSAQARASRLKTRCSVPSLPEYANLSSVEGFFALADAHAKFVAECGEACIEETRNVAQVSMLTQDEMWIWADRLFKSWTELASATPRQRQD